MVLVGTRMSDGKTGNVYCFVRVNFFPSGTFAVVFLLLIHTK